MRQVMFTFRSLDNATWPDDGRTEYQPCRFQATYEQTLRELNGELQRIGVYEAVIEADVGENGVRMDGQLRATVRNNTPRVRISFTHPAVGPLQYPCDTYQHFKDNLRAICKTMAAQRAMDRYGATRKHQQYSGWKMLPGRVTELGAVAPEAPMPLAEAVETLVKCSGSTDTVNLRQTIARTYGVYQQTYRAAVRKVHPDVGGDGKDFQRVIRAKHTLDIHHGVAA